MLCLLAATLLLWDLSSVSSMENTSEVESVYDSLSSGFKLMYSVYQNCENHEDFSTCLKLKALKFADRALRSEKISLIDGMTMVKNTENLRDGRKMEDNITEVDEGSLPQDPDKKQETLDKMLLNKASKFFRSHSLHLSLPKEFADDVGVGVGVEEGRKKELKKYGGVLLMGLMMKGALMAMAYKGVAALAGKALIVAKMALVLSAVVALKKLAGGGGGDEKVTYEIVKHPHVSHAHSYSSGHDFGGHYDSSGGGGGGGGHYKRSLEAEEAAARLAQLAANRYHVPEQPAVLYPQ